MSDEPIIAKGELLGGVLAPVQTTPTRSPEMGLSDAHKKLLLDMAVNLEIRYGCTNPELVAKEFLYAVGITDSNMATALPKWLPAIRKALRSR